MTAFPTPATNPPRDPAPERRLTPDLARGFMLLLIGMAYAPMHLEQKGIGGYGQRPGGGAVDQVMSFLATIFLENRAFPLFGVMFGCGLVMLVSRRRAAGVSDADIRRSLRRRSLWLLVFGFVHATLVFNGEILAAYGIGGLVLAWLLFRGMKAVKIATAVLLGYYALVIVLGAQAVIEAARASAEQGPGLPGYASAYDWIYRLIGAPLAPVINTVFFPMFLLVVIGMWIGKRGLLDEPEAHRSTLRRMAIGGITISVAGGLPLALAGAGVFEAGPGAYAVLFAVQVLTGVAAGVGYAGAFGLVGLRLRQPGRVARALVAAGQRSLTVYLFTSVGVAVVLHPGLLNLGAYTHRAGAMAVAFAVWLVAVLWAARLAAAGKPGPADALLRRLVNGRRRA